MLALADSDAGSDLSSDDDDADRQQVELIGIEKSMIQLDRLAIDIRLCSISPLDALAMASVSRKPELVARFETRAILAVNGLYPDASEILHQRLSKSMTGRYIRLLYWRSRDKKLRTGRRQTQPHDDCAQTKLSTQPVSADEPLQQQHGFMENQLKPENGRVTGDTSWLSGTIPSNTGSHLVLPPATSLTSQPRQFTATGVLNSRAKFPPPPKIEDGEDRKPCPFCRKLLSRGDIADVGRWRLVVLRSCVLSRKTSLVHSPC